MILHIPHSCTNTLKYEINNKDRELLRMTDHYTDELYNCDGASRIVFGVSRLVCDVERFEDDELEPMSSFGMGVCYTKDTEANELREVSNEDRKYIIENYYRPHHQKLSESVDKELNENGTSFIVDCHSFPDTSYHFNSDFGMKRPDICIGTDEYHTPKKLLEDIKKFFLSRGYIVRVDKPYAGTMVPLKHYKKDNRVNSIMIEINRKLYMDDEGSKTEHFSELKDELSIVLEMISDFDLKK